MFHRSPHDQRRSSKIALDTKTVMDKSRGDKPLSIDRFFFYYLQVIPAWIKLSTLTVTFRHVKRHQTNKVAYNQLDWWVNVKKMKMGWPKTFFVQVQKEHYPTENLTFSQCFISKNGHLHNKVQNVLESVETHCTPICMVLVPWPIRLRRTTYRRIPSVYCGRSLDWQ